MTNHNDQEAPETTDQAPETTTEMGKEPAIEHQTMQVDPACAASLNDLSRLRASFGAPINDTIETIEKSLIQMVEQRDHARSVLPGAAHPIDCAMGQIDKMANIADRIHKDMMPKLFAEFGTVVQVVHFGLDAAQNAQIRCAVSANERVVARQQYNEIACLVNRIAEFVGLPSDTPPAQSPPVDENGDDQVVPASGDIVDNRAESDDDGENKSPEVAEPETQEASSA